MSLMRSPMPHGSLLIYRLASLALALWLGGMGCLIGCEMDAMAASLDPYTSVDGYPTSAGSGEDRCQQVKPERIGKGVTTHPEPGRATTCSPFSGQSAVAEVKPRPSGEAGIALPVNEPSFAGPAEAHEPQGFSRLRVPDRGSTRLRCCVFLI